MPLRIKKNSEHSLTPYWNPLEELPEPTRIDALTSMMYMAGWTLEDGTIVHAFKHKITSNYLMLSDDGRAWSYFGGVFSETDKSQAIRSIPLTYIDGKEEATKQSQV